MGGWGWSGYVRQRGHGRSQEKIQRYGEQPRPRRPGAPQARLRSHWRDVRPTGRQRSVTEGNPGRAEPSHGSPSPPSLGRDGLSVRAPDTPWDAINHEPDGARAVRDLARPDV